MASLKTSVMEEIMPIFFPSAKFLLNAEKQYPMQIRQAESTHAIKLHCVKPINGEVDNHE